MNKRCTILPILLGRQGGFPLREENKWRSFLLAFTLTLMLLAFIMVLTVMAVQPSMPRQNSRDDPPEISYRPVAGDALTMVVVGRAQDGAWRFPPHPLQSSVRAGAPRNAAPETLVTLGGERLTLSEAWERGGGVLRRRRSPSVWASPSTGTPPSRATSSSASRRRRAPSSSPPLRDLL